MRTIARWGFVAAAALLFVSSIGATVMVVDVDGTSYSVDVVEAPGGTSEDSTALELTLTNESGTQTSLIAPTQDHQADHDPFLMLVPGSPGPVLIWSRRNGTFDQIAFSKFENQQWSPVEYLTSSPRHHVRPEAGVDAFGTGYIVWTELGRNGSAMLATFDPLTGNLESSPRDLFRELVRKAPAEILKATHVPTLDAPIRGGGRNNHFGPDVTPDGGGDVPNVPPGASNNTNSVMIASPACGNAVAGVAKNRALWLGILHHGSVVQNFRSVVPEGASDDYVALLLQTILEQHCN
ncbi:MAG TPA: hypothetical protein VFW45_04300 [Candidatus Polarisedimenticolia bacterium]|nr:hypothetical protein [Candidatus Polarisedimenticolia bacterium]